MALGVSEEHLELAASVRGWAERHWRSAPGIGAGQPIRTALRPGPGRAGPARPAPAGGVRRPGLRPQRAGRGPGGAGPGPGPGRLPAHGAGQRALLARPGRHTGDGHRQTAGRAGGRVAVRGRRAGHRADRHGRRRRADPRRRVGPGPRRRAWPTWWCCRVAEPGRRSAVGRGQRRGPDHHRAGQPGPDPPAGHGPRQPGPGARRADPARPDPHRRSPAWRPRCSRRKRAASPAGRSGRRRSTPGSGTSSAGRSASSRRSSTGAPGCSPRPSRPPRPRGTPWPPAMAATADAGRDRMPAAGSR